MSDYIEWRKRAFDLVTEITKQVLTLSAGIITLSIAFFKDFATQASSVARTFMSLGWGAYALSILFGLLTLMASAGLQQEAAENVGTQPVPPSINSVNIRLIGGLQLGTFFVGILLTVIAGIIAISSGIPDAQPSTDTSVSVPATATSSIPTSSPPTATT